MPATMRDSTRQPRLYQRTRRSMAVTLLVTTMIAAGCSGAAQVGSPSTATTTPSIATATTTPSQAAQPSPTSVPLLPEGTALLPGTYATRFMPASW